MYSLPTESASHTHYKEDGGQLPSSESSSAPAPSAIKLWNKAFSRIRAISRFKLTAVSCATCPVENILNIFEEKNTFLGASPPKHFMRKFGAALRDMVPVFLEGVTSEVFLQVCVNLQFLYFEPDDFLMSVGDTPDGWYFIVAGSCAVFASNEDAMNEEGSAKRLNVIKSGVGFGELGFLTETAKRNATITATAPHGAYTLFVPKLDYVEHLIRFMKKNDNIIDTQRLLCQSALLHWLDDRALIQLAHGVVVRDVEPFEVYKNQGDQLDEVFVVQTGFIKLVQRVGALSCTLAVLGPGDVGGISDLVVSLARNKNEAFCRCTYRTEGQRARLLLLRRHGFEQTVLSTLMPLVEDVVKVRLVWEAMRVRHKQRHPGTHMAITKNMMETYGYTRGPAEEMIQKRNRTKEEDLARKQFYRIGKRARRLARSVGVGPDTAMQNDTEVQKIVQDDRWTNRRKLNTKNRKNMSSSVQSNNRDNGNNEGSGDNNGSGRGSTGDGRGGGDGDDGDEDDYSHLDVPGRLRLAHDLYVQAVRFAKIARLGREAITAARLGEQCLQAMVLEDFKSLRVKARRLTQIAKARVAEVLRPIDANNENKGKERRLQALAKKCDHKVMIAFSSWMRAAKLLKEYMDMGKLNVKDDMIETQREMKSMKKLMQSLQLKKNELKNILPVKKVPRKRYEELSDEMDSSDDDMSMYVTTPATDRGMHDTRGLTLATTELARWNLLDGSDISLLKNTHVNVGEAGGGMGKSRVRWNMQGTIVPGNTDVVLDSVMFAAKLKQRSQRGHPQRPPGSPSALVGASPRKKTTNKKDKKNDASTSSVTVLPCVLPPHLVNMHVCVCESNTASGKLLKYLLEGEARRNLQFSCVVDIVTGAFKKGTEDPFIVQQQIAYGTQPNGFTFVVLDLGNVFSNKMTAMQYAKLPAPRRHAWKKRMYARKEQMINTSKQHFKDGCSIFCSIGEPGWEHLLVEMCKRGVVSGMIPKPYSAMGVRRLLKEHYYEVFK
jgi:CRP-like cAMP-binding protein